MPGANESEAAGIERIPLGKDLYGCNYCMNAEQSVLAGDMHSLALHLAVHHD
eukprot:CAMPEP_0179985170 /NCGR_PEP_ID=MMETSP0984-20121128/1539_1 /TAXON_ID=483367 /ORGANISM="non described non described, Strain CCMP 2436" /LENGTH=51 /DNA_ID=CAMNT_0021903837 /DNA_START=121 /DNA_END=277 /DNA_ORIENTATION=+